MNNLTPEQRARVLELHRLYHRTRTGVESVITDADNMLPSSVKAWLAVEEHVLDRLTADSDERIRAWHDMAEHPFFADCYRRTNGGTFLDAILTKLDAAHTHTCRPVWRPTTAEEIQPGWEVRSRDHLGAEATWGVAHLQTDEGGWLTESGSLLSCRGDGWAYETTAPLPEPVPDPRVDLLEGVCLREGVVLTRSDAALLLSIADAVEPSKAES